MHGAHSPLFEAAKAKALQFSNIFQVRLFGLEGVLGVNKVTNVARGIRVSRVLINMFSLSKYESFPYPIGVINPRMHNGDGRYPSLQRRVQKIRAPRLLPLNAERTPGADAI